MQPGAEYMQQADSESKALANGHTENAAAADSGKSVNRQNYELGINRGYAVRLDPHMVRVPAALVSTSCLRSSSYH